MQMDKELKLYGTDWCTKSIYLRNYLQSVWVEFKDFNVETNKEAEETIKSLYGGELKFPTVIYRDTYLKNPSISELNAFLNKNGLLDV